MLPEWIAQPWRAAPEASGASGIALRAALRGTLTAAIPFLALMALGHRAEALLATVAVLNLSIADSGGPYRQRLVIMAVIALLVPCALVLGMHTGHPWWLATGTMFLIAFAGGLARALGGVGTPIGLIASIVFLVGVEVPGGWAQSLQFAGAYLGGAAWTILVVLILWRLRPYLRVRYEIGECFAQLAAGFRLLEQCVSEPKADCAHRLATAQARVRDATQRAQDLLGDTFFDVGSAPSFLSDMVVLVRAAERMNASGAGLAEALGALGPRPAHRPRPAAARVQGVLGQVATDCHAIAVVLLERAETGQAAGAGAEPNRFHRIEPEPDDDPSTEEAATLVNVIARQLDNAVRIADRLSGHARRGGLLPPLHGPSLPRGGLSLLRSNLTFESLVFRHALRVATAAGVGMAAYQLLHVPHGMWVPLTVLIVLQPQLGSTVSRALHRTAGTLLGAVLAAVLVYLLRDTPGMEAAVLACLFFTLLFFRRRYWLAVVFLTPLILLLLTLLTGRPWVEIVERIGDTLLGAALALLAVYTLWPSWEHRQLPDLLAAALEADRRYLAALVEATGRGTEAGWPLAGLRVQAELATSNLRAALDRMLAEPSLFRGTGRRAIALVTHIERLTRHVTRMSIHLHQVPGTTAALGDLGARLDAALAALGEAAHSGRPPSGDEPLEHAYVQARRAWQEGTTMHGRSWRVVDSLAGSIVSDINGIRAALSGEPT